MRPGLAIITLIIFQIQFSQAQIKSFEVITKECTPHFPTEVNLKYPVQALSVVLPIDISYRGSLIITPGNDTIRLVSEEEDLINRALIKSNISALVYFNHPVSSFSYFNNSDLSSITFHLYNPGDIVKRRMPETENTTNCDKPTMISQDEWRAGLLPPSHGPEYTVPEHIIIHHSATLNNAEARQVVRTIYIMHTQTNGWNDIAYNYLVAGDGTIFRGRDGQGVYEEDFVKGAHFCSKNSNTLGICILGTYVDVPPTPEAIQALKDIIAWKLYKDNISPIDSSIHPKYSGTKYLDVIAGHRDGCATACPGDSIYVLLPGLRNQVKIIVDGCSQTNSIHSSGLQSLSCRFSNISQTLIVTSKNPQQVKSVDLISLNGKIIYSETPDKKTPFTILLPKLPHGMYLVKLNTNTGFKTALISTMP